ncbi:MAG TPA: ABC transporter substrate-binding protein, partial [Tepidisphaeraceae bacterium]|nr:ABC transporter substrate-binding protein [Tepidisphaeraceae bacterium]
MDWGTKMIRQVFHPSFITHHTSLLLAALLCSACVAQQDGGTDTVVVFKHGKMAGEERTFRALLDEFEHRHPGLKVRDELLPSSTDQQHQFYAINLEGHQVPFDLFAVDVIWVQEFARAGWIRNLDGLLPASERDDFFPAALQAATFEGSLYAAPWYLDTGVLFYRRDLLQRYGLSPPRTWPELLDGVRRILDGERDPSLKGFLWTGKQYEGLVCVALEFIWGHGGDLFSVDSPNAQGEAEAALHFMRQLIDEGISPDLVTTADEETTRHLFGDGRAIYMRNWPYAWSLFQTGDSKIRDRVGLARLPAFPGHESVSALGGWLLAIPHGAPHAAEAAELLKFLISPAVQRRMGVELGYKPAFRRLYRDPALLAAQPWLTDLYPLYLSARPRLVSPYYLMLSQVVQPELSAAVVGTKHPRQALES